MASLVQRPGFVYHVMRTFTCDYILHTKNDGDLNFKSGDKTFFFEVIYEGHHESDYYEIAWHQVDKNTWDDAMNNSQ